MEEYKHKSTMEVSVLINPSKACVFKTHNLVMILLTRFWLYETVILVFNVSSILLCLLKLLLLYSKKASPSLTCLAGAEPFPTNQHTEVKELSVLRLRIHSVTWLTGNFFLSVIECCVIYLEQARNSRLPTWVLTLSGQGKTYRGQGETLPARLAFG